MDMIILVKFIAFIFLICVGSKVWKRYWREVL